MSSKEYFARIAEDWDTTRSGFFTAEMRDAAVALANLSADAVVADVGTGTGFVIQGVAAQVSKVYGFDESPEMLAVAERNLASFDNVVLQQAPASQLPLPDNALDAVFGNMYLHHDPDPAAAIRELARVLRPDGQLILTDLDAHDQAWMIEEMADRWLGFARQDIEAWFEAAGLVDVSVEDAQGRCNSSDPDGEEQSLTIFVARGQKKGGY